MMEFFKQKKITKKVDEHMLELAAEALKDAKDQTFLEALVSDCIVQPSENLVNKMKTNLHGKIKEEIDTLEEEIVLIAENPEKKSLVDRFKDFFKQEAPISELELKQALKYRLEDVDKLMDSARDGVVGEAPDKRREIILDFMQDAIKKFGINPLLLEYEKKIMKLKIEAKNSEETAIASDEKCIELQKKIEDCDKIVHNNRELIKKHRKIIMGYEKLEDKEAAGLEKHIEKERKAIEKFEDNVAVATADKKAAQASLDEIAENYSNKDPNRLKLEIILEKAAKLDPRGEQYVELQNAHLQEEEKESEEERQSENSKQKLE